MYEASGGYEYFLQMIDPQDRTIFGLCRLRIPSQIFSGEPHFLPVLQNSAIIRELHVFGDQLPVGFHPKSQNAQHPAFSAGQHQGFGKKMLQAAEDIVREKYPHVEGLAIIAGAGVRQYYANRGYTLQEEYMKKYF